MIASSAASNQVHTADNSIDMSNYSAARPTNTLLGMGGNEDAIEKLIYLERGQVSKFEMSG